MATESPAILYEHADGRRAVVSANRLATFAIDNPDWHRAGPVEIVWVDETAPAWRPIEAAPLPAVQQGDASPTMPKNIEMMAINRYRPVPSGVLAYKVVGGDGNRSLFSGTKDECQIVARKLTEAFLDGAHVALAAHPAAPVAQGDALTPADADQLEKVITDFEECGETDVPYAALQRYAAMGYLECAHYHVLPAAHEAIAVARSQAKEGA